MRPGIDPNVWLHSYVLQMTDKHMYLRESWFTDMYVHFKGFLDPYYKSGSYFSHTVVDFGSLTYTVAEGVDAFV